MRIGLYRGDAASGPIDKIVDATRRRRECGIHVVLAAADDGNGRDGRARRGRPRGSRHRARHRGGADVPAPSGGDGPTGADHAVDQRRPVHPRDRAVAPDRHRGHASATRSTSRPATCASTSTCCCRCPRGLRAGLGGDADGADATLDVRGSSPLPVLLAALAPQMLQLAGARGRRHGHVDVWPSTLDEHVVPRSPRPPPRRAGTRRSSRAGFPVCVTDDPDGAARRRPADVRDLRHAAVVPGDARPRRRRGPRRRRHRRRRSRGTPSSSTRSPPSASPTSSPASSAPPTTAPAPTPTSPPSSRPRCVSHRHIRR